MSRSIESRSGQPYTGLVRCDHPRCVRWAVVTPPELLDQELLSRPFGGEEPGWKGRTWLSTGPQREAFMDARKPQHEINHARPLPVGWVSLNWSDRYQGTGDIRRGRSEFCGMRHARLWIDMQERKAV